jgi:hypothetical protein
VRVFACNCGAVHSDYCVNCGRWASLGPQESVELTGWDAVCVLGPVPHDHPWEEKELRMTAVHERIRDEIRKTGARTEEEVRAVVRKIVHREAEAKS